jgi:O-antigen/teichoic acid export membrane protein
MVWVLLGEISSKVALLITTFASARLLDPNAFAIYSGFLAIMLLSAAVSDLGLSQLLTRELAGCRSGTVDGLIRVLTRKLAILPLWVITVAVSTWLLLSNQTVGGDVIIGYALGSLLVSAQLPFLGALRGLMQFRSAAAVQASGRWFTAVLILGAVITSPKAIDPERLVMGVTVLGEAVLLALSMLFLRSHRNKTTESSSGGLTLIRALPFAANTILSLVYNRMDIVIVAALTTATQLDAYAPASRIQDAAYILPTAVTSVAFPLFAQRMFQRGVRPGRDAQTTFLIVVGLGVTVPAILVLTLLTPQFIGIVLGSEFLGSVTATRILIWSIPFSVVNATLLSQLTAGPRPALSTWVFLTALISSVGMHVLLTPRFGAEGAALASFSRDPISLFVSAMLVMRMNKKANPNEFEG